MNARRIPLSPIRSFCPTKCSMAVGRTVVSHNFSLCRSNPCNCWEDLLPLAASGMALLILFCIRGFFHSGEEGVDILGAGVFIGVEWLLDSAAGPRRLADGIGLSVVDVIGTICFTFGGGGSFGALTGLFTACIDRFLPIEKIWTKHTD